MDAQSLIAANVMSIRERIGAAAEESGRSPDAVTLVAVTKYVDAEITRLVWEAGCLDIGESRPQALWKKHDSLDTLPVRWHLIGHLQSNKVRRTVALNHLALVQSVDRMPLLDGLEAEASRINRRLDILLEVRISDDEAKHGFAPDALEATIADCLERSHLRLRGLMGMASFAGGMDQARREFTALRDLRDRLAIKLDCAQSLEVLSMGMSRDFETAIACGATMVRIGSSLFQGLDE